MISTAAADHGDDRITRLLPSYQILVKRKLDWQGWKGVSICEQRQGECGIPPGRHLALRRPAKKLPDLSQFEEAVWHRRGSDCDIAEAWHHDGEIVSAVEAVLEFGEVAGYMLVGDGAVSASDGA